MCLEAGGIAETIHGLGSRGLSFSNPKEIVGRKSLYTSDRTIMIGSDKAASDLDRRLIAVLKSPNTKLKVQIIVDAYSFNGRINSELHSTRGNFPNHIAISESSDSPIL